LRHGRGVKPADNITRGRSGAEGKESFPVKCVSVLLEIAVDFPHSPCCARVNARNSRVVEMHEVDYSVEYFVEANEIVDLLPHLTVSDGKDLIYLPEILP